MILTCPNCETQYFAAEGNLPGDGQDVKCTACGHEWRVERTPEAIVEPKPPGHEIWRQRQKKRAAKARRVVSATAWGLGLAVFVATLSAAVLFRNELVRYWPQSATAFETVGLDINRFGLDIVDVQSNRDFDGTTPVLSITGKLVNVTRITQPAAGVRIGLKDETDVELKVIFARPETAEIGPGAQTGFEVVLVDPPSDAFTLDVSLIELADIPEEPQTLAGDTSSAAEPAPISGPDAP